jgi:hypothetical protein
MSDSWYVRKTSLTVVSAGTGQGPQIVRVAVLEVTAVVYVGDAGVVTWHGGLTGVMLLEVRPAWSSVAIQ